MRFLITFLFLTTFCSYGQIINSLSGDRTGMFYYSVDTLISQLRQEKEIDRIVIKADKSITKEFPKIIQGIKIVKHDLQTEYKKGDLLINDVIINVSGLAIIRDQITLSIATYEKTKDGMPWFAQGAYVFYFKYFQDSEEYKLVKIKSGMRL